MEVVCPGELERLYFRKFQLKFANQPGSVAHFMNFRIAKRGLGREIPLTQTIWGLSLATEKTRLLFQRYGMDAEEMKKFKEIFEDRGSLRKYSVAQGNL